MDTKYSGLTHGMTQQDNQEPTEAAVFILDLDVVLQIKRYVLYSAVSSP